ncbi:hypothetical protein ACFL5V_06860 [Fibrobacterota bacterium]
MKTGKIGWVVLALSVLAFPKSEKSKTALFTPEEAAVIRAFVAAIEADDYAKVEAMLARQERKLLQGAGKKFPFAVIRRLKAFKVKSLLRDPEIRVENGKIIGIYKKLQVHGLTELMKEKPQDVPEEGESVEEEEDEQPESIRERETETTQVEAVFNDFMAAIDRRDFKSAVNMIDPEELNLFLGYKGQITPGMANRLSKLDRQGENLLQLRNGKLTNVYLLLSPDQLRLEKTVERFVDAVRSGNWDNALAMLTHFERNFLTGKDKTIKPEYKEKLSRLKPEEYTVFYLFDDRLSGTLEWMGLGVYGEKAKGK